MSSQNIEVKEINKNIDHRTIPRVFFVCIRGIRVLFLVCICVCVMWLFSPFFRKGSFPEKPKAEPGNLYIQNTCSSTKDEDLPGING